MHKNRAPESVPSRTTLPRVARRQQRWQSAHKMNLGWANPANRGNWCDTRPCTRKWEDVDMWDAAATAEFSAW